MRTAARRGVRRLLAGLLVAAALVACTGTGPPPARSDALRVASFDFVENQLLSEIYAAALEGSGYDVIRLPGLGPREVALPALEQGLVDLVPEYAGSALRFLDDATGRPRGPRAQEPGPALRRALAELGLTALALAPGQDQNAIAVTQRTAREHGLRTISDLAAVAPQLTLGGPPECPERALCLRGLRSRYGLRFRAFVPVASRAVTAEALLAGQLDVGVLETVDAYLADGRLRLLEDDRALQPPENVVPVVRQDVVDEHGRPLTEVLDAVTRTLTTAAMVGLNREVVLEGRPVADVAAEWVQQHGLVTSGR